MDKESMEPAEAAEFFTQILQGLSLSDISVTDSVKSFVSKVVDLKTSRYSLDADSDQEDSDDSLVEDDLGLLKSTEQLSYAQDEMDALIEQQDFIENQYLQMNQPLVGFLAPSPSVEQSINEANDHLMAKYTSITSEIADYQATADFNIEQICQYMRGSLETVYVSQILRNLSSVEEPQPFYEKPLIPLQIVSRPKRFVTRLVNTFPPLKVNMRQQEFPPRDQLSYDCYLSGVLCCLRMQCFNFIMSDSRRSKFQNYDQAEQQVNVEPQAADVRLVICWYSPVNGLLTGLQLFDKTGRTVLQTSVAQMADATPIQTELGEGERIVGFRSWSTSPEISGLHYNFQLVVGSLI